METLGISVPCYNEYKNIPIVIEAFDKITNSYSHVNVVLVDNGSTDETKDLLPSMIQSKNNPRLKTVRIEKNIGYGNGILEGLKQLDSSILSWTHADLQTDPEDIIKAYNLYIKISKEKNDRNYLIKGKRKKRNVLEATFTFGMQIISFIFLKTYLSDINAQPKVFPREFYNLHLSKDAPKDFSLDLFALYTAKKNNIKIKTIPVYFNKRIHGEAKGGGSWQGRIRLILRTLKYILKLSNKVT